MEKQLNKCGICGGTCQVKILVEDKKKYLVVCSSCGNESDLKTSRTAAVAAHNRTRYQTVKSLLTGAPDVKASPK